MSILILLAMALFVGLIGASSVAALFFQPRSLLSIPQLFIPGVAYFVKTQKPLIALTIDDGPDAQTTPKILEVLERYDAKATFFLISDRVFGNETLIETLIAQGHEIGNHLTQDCASINLSPRAFEADLRAADAALSRFSKPRWMRPGCGWYNATMIQTAQRSGYRVALGSIFPFDTNIPSSRYAATQILTTARSGAIVVLHDTGDWGIRTAQTLEIVLPKLQQRGYQVVTLSQLFETR